MSILSTTTKAKAGAKVAKGAAKRPRVLLAGTKAAGSASKLGLKATKPYAKRRARQRVDQLSRTGRTVGQVGAGMVIGAGAMYFLEPEHGQEHRRKVTHLVV